MHATLIEIIKEASSYRIYSSFSLTNAFWQDKLKRYHNQQRQIRCGCGVWLSVVFKNDKYFLRSYPNQPKQHLPSCCYENTNKELCDENGNFSLKIFEYHRPKSTDPRHVQVASQQNDTRENKFSHFCTYMIESASAYAFNAVNKGKDTICIHPNWTDFLWAFYRTNTRILAASSIEKLKRTLLSKNINFSYGITYQPVEEMLKTSEFISLDAHNNKHRHKISKRAAEQAAGYVQIFDKYIDPPYFYVALASKGVIRRIFMAAISDYCDKLAFVESQAERDFCAKLTEAEHCFLKPFGDEYNQLARKLNRPIYLLPYRPDFFVFTAGDTKPIIAELCGNISADYMKQLEEKETYYKNLQQFRYFRFA